MPFKYMLNSMKAMGLWVVAVVDMALSGVLAKLLVIEFGWRWYDLDGYPLDVSTSMVGYWLVLGTTLPLIVLLVIWQSSAQYKQPGPSDI